MDVSIAVMNTRHAKIVEKMNDLEEKKNNLAEALAMSGMSERKVRRSEVIKLYDEQIRKGYENMRQEKESAEIRKNKMDERIAVEDRKSNPYRDKREEFVRIKENRPLDMGVETRTRSAGFDGRESAQGHVRNVESGESDQSGENGERMAEIKGRVPANVLVSHWNRHIHEGASNGVDFGGASSMLDQRDFFNISGLSQNEALGVKDFMDILSKYYKYRKVSNDNLNATIKRFSEQN